MTADAITDRAIHAQAAQKRPEFLHLVAHVLDLRPSVVVEIGTMKGGTLRAWCECAADDALIVSIDLPGGRWGGETVHPDDRQRLASYARPSQRLELIAGDSHDAAVYQRLEEILDGRPIDFLFIDGDHTYPGVKADFEEYAPLVREGGSVAFHDILPHPQVPECDVNLLWDEIKVRYDTQEFCFPGDERGYGPWGGIGLLRWEGGR